jgi:hypothetical protein
MDLHPRKRRKVAPGAGHGEVRRVRDHVAQVKQVERALVRHYGAVLADGEPGGEDVFAWGRGILAVTVESASDAEESAALDVVGKQRPTVAAVPRLLGREIASLLRGDLEEPGTIRSCGPMRRRGEHYVTNISNDI